MNREPRRRSKSPASRSGRTKRRSTFMTTIMTSPKNVQPHPMRAMRLLFSKPEHKTSKQKTTCTIILPVQTASWRRGGLDNRMSNSEKSFLQNANTKIKSTHQRCNTPNYRASTALAGNVAACMQTCRATSMTYSLPHDT